MFFDVLTVFGETLRSAIDDVLNNFTVLRDPSLEDFPGPCQASLTGEQISLYDRPGSKEKRLYSLSALTYPLSTLAKYSLAAWIGWYCFQRIPARVFRANAVR